LLIIPVAAALLLAAFGWRNARIKRLRRRFYQRNVSASVLAVCRYAMDMLRFAGCEPLKPLQMPEDYAAAAAKRLPWIDRGRLQAVLELAQRARFSGRPCTKQDRNTAAAFTAAVHAGLNAHLPRIRRWLFRWRYPAL